MTSSSSPTPRRAVPATAAPLGRSASRAASSYCMRSTACGTTRVPPRTGPGVETGSVDAIAVWQMPCRMWMAGKACNRGHKCTYAHTHTSLTRLLAHLNNARRYLDICVYCFTCNEIADAVRQPHRACRASSRPPCHPLYAGRTASAPRPCPLCMLHLHMRAETLTFRGRAQRGRCWRRIDEACRSA